MEPDDASHASGALEKVLEYRLLGELSTSLWLRGNRDFEILRSEVDSHGYDLVIEANQSTRHIQLMATRKGGRRSEVTLSTRLAAKPSGCVIWMVYDPLTLELGPFLWFGGAPGEPLPALGSRIAHHTKGNAAGEKTARAAHRIVEKSQFQTIDSIHALADRLFGAAPPASSSPSQSPTAIG